MALAKVNGLFLSSYAFMALNVGAQLVFVSWMAAGVLGLSAVKVGWVQASVLLPNLLLMLVGGAIADKFPPARIMTLANAALAVAHIGFAVYLQSHQQAMTSLVLYAISMGVANVFVQTAKERLAAQQTQQTLHKSLSLASMVQFSAQGLGILVAMLGDQLGPAGIAYLLGCICAVAAILFYRLSLSSAKMAHNEEPILSALSSGVRYVFGLGLVRRVLLIVAFNGFLHMGFFLVLMPLLAREHLGNSASGFALLRFTFLVGSVLAHIKILTKSDIKSPEQATLFCLLYAGCLGLAFSYPVTDLGLFILIFCWGVVAGVSANLSRLAVLSEVDDTMRGRVMSIYQLTLFGLAPVGSLVAGYVVEGKGTQQAFSILGWVSIVLFFVLLLLPGYKVKQT